jgi:Cys-tRNA(Pro)/Cys-tRNA(Cys) deacylase
MKPLNSPKKNWERSKLPNLWVSPPKSCLKQSWSYALQKKPLLCIIPGDRRVDLKAVAELCGEKKVAVPTQDEAERLTGLQVGGISPLALINKGFTMYIDSAARDFEDIHISGGQRGLNIRMKVTDLAALTNATFAPLSKTM